MKLAMLMMTATLVAQEVDERILRLIGPDATVVLGVKVPRHRGSNLHGFHPLREAEIDTPAPDLQQLIAV